MIYVSSDWHGVSVEDIKRLLRQADFGKDDFLFILGDVIDRGKHGVDLIKYIMYEPNIELIRGNHEQMLLSCSFLFEEITDSSIAGLTADKMSLFSAWQMNGGEPTVSGLRYESAETRNEILEYLSDTPLYDTVSVGGRDFLLVHGGLGNDGEFKSLKECQPDELLWSRPYIDTEYSRDFMTVLGHTPTHYYGSEYRGKILIRETWIDIDTGAACGLSPSLLRLDDMKAFYLSD